MTLKRNDIRRRFGLKIQNPTPVISFETVKKILSFLPKPIVSEVQQIPMIPMNEEIIAQIMPLKKKGTFRDIIRRYFQLLMS